MYKRLLVSILLHLSVWFLYLFLPNLTSEQEFDLPRFLLRNKEMLLLAAYFYLNVYGLVPTTLEKKKIAWFLGLTLLCFSAFMLIQPFIDIWVFKHYVPESGGGFREFRNRMLERGYHLSVRGVFRNFTQIMFFFALSTGWRIYQRWRLEEKQKDQAQKERLAAELSLLKSQVSPHFLFNSLNSIYSLTVQKSELAPLAVVKLSELLRYMIYQANRETVSLSEEINYIDNFIELQKLRMAADVTIIYEKEVTNKSLEIEPMLLIPIIENTFKHGVSYKTQSEIVIQINEQNGNLHLHTSNRIFHKKSNENSGFGLENLKKRLNLRYPEQYMLQIEKNDTNYTVNFSLNLLS